MDVAEKRKINKQLKKVAKVKRIILIGIFAIVPINFLLLFLFKSLGAFQYVDSSGQMVERPYVLVAFMVYFLLTFPPISYAWVTMLVSANTDLSLPDYELAKSPIRGNFRFTPEQREIIMKEMGKWKEDNRYGYNEDIRDWIGFRVYNKLHELEEQYELEKWDKGNG